MADHSESQVTNSRVESSREQQAVKPDLRADNLLREGSQTAVSHQDRQNVVSADGKQLILTNPYPDHALGGPRAETLQPQRPDGQPQRPDGQPQRSDAPTAQPGADKAIQDKAATLFNKDMTDEQRLATVRELANAGVTNLQVKDAQGKDHNLRFEVEPAGSRQMVHLFETDAAGKEHTALRGIARADGSFEHERNRSGQQVDFHGKGFGMLMGEQPNGPGVTPSDQYGNYGDTRRPGDNRLPSGDNRPPQGDNTPPQGDNRQPQGDTRPPQAGQLPTDGNVVDRSQFDRELSDPRVMAAFAGRMRSEVGTQGYAAQVAFAEEVMNRAASRNQSLMQALSGSYYPTSNPGRSDNPQYVSAITQAWKEGTDTIHGATGNASGHVGFGVRGGHYDSHGRWVSPNQTANIGGERFGYEQVDVNRGWLDKYEELKQRGAYASRQRQNGSDGRV